MSGLTPYRRIAASLVIALTATLALAVPAQAAPRAETPLSCWSNADTGEQQCFEDDATRNAAIEEETGKDLRSGLATNLAAAAQLKLGSSVTSLSVSASATYILAIFYWSANYTDSTWVVTSSYASLCSTYSYSDNDITGGWNNQIGSFKSYGTCKTKLWENPGFSGSSYGLVKLGPTLGYLNDKASAYTISD